MALEVSDGEWVPFLDSFAGPEKPFYGYKLELLEEAVKITFSGLKPPFYNEDSLPYGYIEGLWKYDCGELWLCNPDNGRYIKFNIAPNGSWWSCVFALPRLRDPETKAPQCVPESMLMDTGWFAGFTVSWKEIQRCLGTQEGLVGNVTVVVGGCPDVDPPLQNLRSIVELGAVDFHRPQDWVPIEELTKMEIEDEDE